MRLVFNLREDSKEPERLVSPHFDDETTLLAARPVVPLGQVKSTFRTKGVLALLGTAVLSGFVGGLILIRLERGKSQVRETRANSSNNLTTLPDTALTDQSKESAITKALETPSPEPEVAAPQEPIRSSEPKKRTVDSNVSARVQKQNDTDKGQQPRLEPTPDRRKAESKTEGVRERRATRTHDDIFRISDIFEGSRRP